MNGNPDNGATSWPAGADVVIGSLFSGYGGLEQGVTAALYALGARSVRLAWVADIDPGARKILAHRYPGVLNLGDITRIDWTTVEPVDVYCGGFPCQDVSLAGKRAGLRPDTRSGLWSHMAYGASVLRPRLVVAENVRGLLNAAAHSDVEPCPWCVGDEPTEPALRALGAVLGDMADIGYDTEWRGLRASDIGAPHARFRVFVVAHPADADVQRHEGVDGAPGRRQTEPADGSNSDRDTDSARPGTVNGVRASFGEDTEPRGTRSPVEDTDDATCDERRITAPGQEEERRPRADARGRSRAPTADSGGERHGRREDTGSVGRLDSEDESEARQRQRARAIACDRSSTAAPDADDAGCDQHGRPVAAGPEHDPAEQVGGADWGAYGPAVARWAAVLGRPAPAPTETSSKGGQRLSPRFVEWMMGLPDGHVTDVPGLSRNDMLRALGNGVVPQQAAAAVHAMVKS